MKINSRNEEISTVLRLVWLFTSTNFSFHVSHFSAERSETEFSSRQESVIMVNCFLFVAIRFLLSFLHFFLAHCAIVARCAIVVCDKRNRIFSRFVFSPSISSPFLTRRWIVLSDVSQCHRCLCFGQCKSDCRNIGRFKEGSELNNESREKNEWREAICARGQRKWPNRRNEDFKSIWIVALFSVAIVSDRHLITRRFSQLN